MPAHASIAIAEEATPPPRRWLGMDEAAAAMGLSRSSLDAMVGRAPSTLPGSPMLYGGGGLRRHRRWDAARVDEWLDAYNAWANGNGRALSRPPAVPPPPKPARKSSPISPVKQPAPKPRGPSILARVMSERPTE